MNIVGIMIPKIVALLIIIFSPIKVINKLILIAIWLVKLIIDFDVNRPGHSGKIYRRIQNVKIEIQDLIAALVQFVPALVFFIITIRIKEWLLCLLGIIVLSVGVVIIIHSVKGIVESILWRKKNADTDYKK